eukprot:scaffold9058_cov174-Skeletonema_marinoi.AAC.2
MDESSPLKPRWAMDIIALMMSVMELTAVTSLLAPALALLSSVSWAVRASVEKRKRRAQELNRWRSEERGVEVVVVVGMLNDSPVEEEWGVSIDSHVDDHRQSLFTPSIINEFIQSGQIPLEIRSRAKAIVSRIRGKDYQVPDKKVLTAAYNRGLRALSKEHSGRQNVMITLEHAVYESLSEETRAILFPEHSDFQYQYTVDGDKAEFTIETPNGPHYKVMAPSHVVFGENKSDAHRIMAIKRTVASMAVNNDAGKLSDADFESKIGIFRCFLMQWFGFGGSQDKILGDFNAARKYAIGKNLCNTHFGRAGTQMTANRVGKDVKQPDVIFLRTFLGENLFNAMLTCCGKPSSRANPSPLDDPLQREKWDRDARLAYDRQRNHDPARREYHKKYYQDNLNRARINEQQRANYQVNREAHLAYAHQYRKDNRDACLAYDRQRNRRQYRQDNRDRINERKQQRRESNKEKKARAEAERILKKAEIALTQYTELKKNGALQQITTDVMKSLLDCIVPLHPLDGHDKRSKYKNGSQMRKRLGLPQPGGLHCEKDCFSNYFSNEWKEKWLARILE